MVLEDRTDAKARKSYVIDRVHEDTRVLSLIDGGRYWFPGPPGRWRKPFCVWWRKGKAHSSRCWNRYRKPC
ncbi:hypothetical protein [Enterobacter bugandensis]|uniref:hypothetical protein n=1 Tax=Enterobacter bugandensis TaxID=881260 RepID=UPI003BB0EF6A